MLYIAGRVVPPPVWYSATFMVSRVFVDSVSAPSPGYDAPFSTSPSTVLDCLLRLKHVAVSGSLVIASQDRNISSSSL